MQDTPLWLWLGFNALVLALLALDLGVFHRKAHAVSIREAAIWSGVWIALSLAFGAWIWHARGPQAGLEFLTGYLIEKSLSVDNLFVFALVFAYFKVEPKSQHRVLFWGILGALLLRGLFILGGAALIDRFHWILYLFGAFLILTGVKMARSGEVEIHPEKNPLLRLAKRFLPVASEGRDGHFFVRQGGKLLATPLFLVLVLIESSDLMFAVDSIPAIFAVTRDPFLVYTSNVFAILGLRSLYFVLAGVIAKFVFLKLGLALVLVFVGVKMTIADLVAIPTGLSLGAIALVLSVAIGASLLRDRRLRRLPAE